MWRLHYAPLGENEGEPPGLPCCRHLTHFVSKAAIPYSSPATRPAAGRGSSSATTTASPRGFVTRSEIAAAVISFSTDAGDHTPPLLQLNALCVLGDQAAPRRCPGASGGLFSRLPAVPAYRPTFPAVSDPTMQLITLHPRARGALHPMIHIAEATDAAVKLALQRHWLANLAARKVGHEDAPDEAVTAAGELSRLLQVLDDLRGTGRDTQALRRRAIVLAARLAELGMVPPA